MGHAKTQLGFCLETGGSFSEALGELGLATGRWSDRKASQILPHRSGLQQV